MGAFSILSNCSSNSRCFGCCSPTKVKTEVVEVPIPPNPNPRNYKIINHKQVDRNLVVEVVYPDATNYEGRKIMVYRDVTFKQLKKKKFLDPHFCDHGDCVSPFARFRPTEAGWIAAIALAKLI